MNRTTVKGRKRKRKRKRDRETKDVLRRGVSPFVLHQSLTQFIQLARLCADMMEAKSFVRDTILMKVDGG